MGFPGSKAQLRDRFLVHVSLVVNVGHNGARFGKVAIFGKGIIWIMGVG